MQLERFECMHLRGVCSRMNVYFGSSILIVGSIRIDHAFEHLICFNSVRYDNQNRSDSFRIDFRSSIYICDWRELTACDKYKGKGDGRSFGPSRVFPGI